MAREGFIALFRSIDGHHIFHRKPANEEWAFITLVLDAAWKPEKRRIGRFLVHLNRGETAVSVRYLAEKWGWSRSSVQRFLDRLVHDHMIETVGGTAINVITICNYDKYQSGLVNSGTLDGTEVGHSRDTRGTNRKKETSKQEDSVPTGLAASPHLPGMAEADHKMNGTEYDIKSLVFGNGLKWIMGRTDRKESTVRGFLGKAIQQHGDATVAQALMEAQKENAVEPIAYISGVLKQRGSAYGRATALGRDGGEEHRRELFEALNKLQTKGVA